MIDDLVTYMGAISSAIKTVEIIVSGSGKLDRAEMSLQLANLMEQLALAKVNQSKTLELCRQLQEKLKIRGEVVFESPFVYQILPSGEKNGPFCVVCYHKGDKLIPIIPIDSRSFECKVCSNFYRVRDVAGEHQNNFRDVGRNGPGGWMS